MKNFKSYWLALVALFGLLYCTKDSVANSVPYKPVYLNEDQEVASRYFGLLPEVADHKDNPTTDEKVYLGKVLFHDPLLSANGTQSCNTCHNLVTYGVDNQQFSKGDAGEFGGRNTPTVFNAALHLSQFWDGRSETVEDQAEGPMMNPVEMAMSSTDEVVRRIKATDYYPELFKKAFPEDKDPMNFENVKKSIGAFERTLLTKSKFDRYLAGDAKALNNEEVEGMRKFINTGCITCHGGATMGGQMYQKFGVYFPYEVFTKSIKVDEGRMEVTKNAADQFMFKVMSLRNVEKTAPYFHDGSVKTLEDAVKVMAKVQHNVDLTETEIKSVVTFLKTLTGDIPEGVSEIPKEVAHKQ